MTYHNWYMLLGEAKAASSEEQFLGESVYSSALSERLLENPEEMVKALKNIYWIANASIRDIRQTAGLSRPQFCERFAVSIRTLENWEARGGCADYLRLAFADLLGLITVTREWNEASHKKEGAPCETENASGAERTL